MCERVTEMRQYMDVQETKDKVNEEETLCEVTRNY